MFKPTFKLFHLVQVLVLLALGSHAFAADPVYLFKNYTPGIRGNYALVADPQSLAFDPVIAGQTSAPQSVTFHNVGTSPISFVPFTVNGEFTQSNTCGLLAAGATCSASVVFAPTQLGEIPGSLATAYDNGRALNIALSGTGLGSLPIATLSTSVVNFGAVPLGTVDTRAVQLDNTGQQSLSVSGVTTAGAAFGASHTCATLEPAENCFANVTFTPSQVDPVSGTLEFTTNAPGSPHQVALSGSGATPVIGFSPAAPLTFTSTAVGATSEVQAVTISNTSALATLGITGIAADAPFSAETTTCTTTLAPGTNCIVNVAYVPTSIGAGQTGALHITGDLTGSGFTYQLSGGQAAYALTGTAVAAVPEILLSEAPATGEFGNVALGTPSSKVVTLTNTGYGALHLTSTSLSGADVAEFAKSDSTCETRTLAKDESCAITVTATPTIPGAKSATLTFGNTDGATGNTVVLTATGQSAVITLKDTGANVISNLGFPSTDVGSNSTAIAARIYNTGDAPLAFNSDIAATGPFSVQSTDCSTSTPVAVGGYCTVNLVFSPTIGGANDGTLPISSNAYNYTPLTLTGTGSLTGVLQVAAGAFHTVVLKTDGTVWATGYNSDGQLGDGTTTDRSTFVQSTGMTGVTAIAAGGSHSLALMGDVLYATGSNAYGQLGDGTTTSRSTFVQSTGMTGVTAIAAGGKYSLALKGNVLYATGYNYSGQLGDDTTTDRSTFVQSTGMTGVTAIAAGGSHSLALMGDVLYATGSNAYGQLGDGTTTSRSAFVQSTGMTGVTAIAAGTRHSLALMGDVLYATGYNFLGALGDGTTTDRSTFVQSTGMTGVTAITAGYHSLALKGNILYATGYNVYGQLGDGTTTSRSTFGLVTP